MGQTIGWLKNTIVHDGICDEYKERVDEAMNKKDLIDIVFDANGISWLPKQRMLGNPLPYRVIMSEFPSFMNGRYIAQYKNANGLGYTSSMFIGSQPFGYKGDVIEVPSTLCCVMDFKGTIRVNWSDYVKLYLDQNTDVKLEVPNSSVCIVYLFGDAKCKCKNKGKNVQILKWQEGD